MATPPRIIKETQRLAQEPIPGIEVRVNESNVRHFFVIIDGAAETPFAGGKF